MFVVGSQSACEKLESRRSALAVLRNGVVDGQYVKGIMLGTSCS